MPPVPDLIARQRSRVPHYAAALCFAVIVFASLYPFTGWTDSGQPWLEFLFYPAPYYSRPFDKLVNVLVYVPYGFALALTAQRRLTGWLLAVALSALTSFGVELAQMFLPTRIASNVDIACNLGGAVVGASLAVSPWFDRLWRRVWFWRLRYFSALPAADYALLLMAVWFLTQLNPAIPLFGVVVRPQGLPQPFVSPLDNPLLFLLLVEAGGAMLHLTAILLFVTAFLADRRYALRAVIVVVGAAWFVKVLAAGMLLKPMAFFEWINENVTTGLAAGVLLVWLFTRFSRRVQAWAALLALMGAQLMVALWPLSGNERDVLSLFRWHYGHLLNINALVDFLIHLWPVGAAVCLIAYLREVAR